MGLIIDGVYYPDGEAELKTNNVTVDSIAKENSFDRTYENHAHDLIQPYNPDGKGVIYYLKDEWNNEAAYDFKSITFPSHDIRQV